MRVIFYIILLATFNANAETDWKVKVPVSADTLLEIQKEITAEHSFSDEGVTCGGEIISTALTAYNPPNWFNFNPAIQNPASVTASAFYKFEVITTTPVDYCASEVEIACQITFDTFKAGGQLDETKYRFVCEEPILD